MQIKTFIYKLKHGSYWLDSEPMDDHIERMMKAGWEPMNSANDTGHVRVGKTLALTALTGGLSLLFGASRTPQTITITFKKETSDSQHGRGSGTRENVALDISTTATAPQGDRQAPAPAESRNAASALGAVGFEAGRLTVYLKSHPIFVVGAFGLLGLFLVWVWNTPQASSSGSIEASRRVQRPVIAPILDLPSLALRKRSEVEKILGKPLKYIRRKSEGELADEADYPWGIAGYNRFRLNFLILRFQAKPNNYEEAFELLHLPHPPPPYVANGYDTTQASWRDHPITQLFWRDQPYGTGYTCCENMAFHDIWISSDWKEMHILILDLDAPEEWSDEEGRMYVQRTGLPLPKAARFKGDPLQWPITPKAR